MKLTVDEILQLVYQGILAEPDSFSRKSVIRRLAQLRANIGSWSQLRIEIPKPKMSEEAEELLKNSQKAKIGPPRKRKPRKPRVDIVPEATVVAGRKDGPMSAQTKKGDRK